MLELLTDTSVHWMSNGATITELKIFVYTKNPKFPDQNTVELVKKFKTVKSKWSTNPKSDQIAQKVYTQLFLVSFSSLTIIFNCFIWNDFFKVVKENPILLVYNHKDKTHSDEIVKTLEKIEPSKTIIHSSELDKTQGFQNDMQQVSYFSCDLHFLWIHSFLCTFKFKSFFC